MNYFFNLELLTPYFATKPFDALRTIKWRAEQILQKESHKRTAEQIDCAASTLKELLDEFKNERAEEELENYAARLYDRGGWELGYLEFGNDTQPSLRDIRNLLKSWPSWADDKPNLTQAEDFDDLDSLQEILCSGYPFDDIPGFPQASEAECYAVLALMKLEEAASHFFIPEKRTTTGISIYPGRYPWTVPATIEGANNIICAMEIICYAERTIASAYQDEWNHQRVHETQERLSREYEQQERKARSERATDLAKIRWAEDTEKRKAAVVLIKSYWDIWNQDRSLYKNQGEFSRDMEEKIETQIGRGRNDVLLYSASTIEVKLIPKIRLL